MKKKISVLIVFLMASILLQGCNAANTSDKTKVVIAYQYGISYAPVVIAQEEKLIEKIYEEKTGKKLEVEWNQMSSGADINTGFATGSIDVGFMGTSPALSGISKKLNYKIFTAVSGQQQGLMTNNTELNSLSDVIEKGAQIATVNLNSHQHIVLAMALKNAGYDAHALDAQIVAMKHPDGYSSVVSGNIDCHLTNNPYLYNERQNPDLHEIPEIAVCWSAEKTAIVGIMSEDMYGNEKEIYDSVCEAISEAVDLIHEDVNYAALITSKYDGSTAEDEAIILGQSVYKIDTQGLLDLAKFLYEEGFIANEIQAYEDIVFDNVKGN